MRAGLVALVVTGGLVIAASPVYAQVDDEPSGEDQQDPAPERDPLPVPGSDPLPVPGRDPLPLPNDDDDKRLTTPVKPPPRQRFYDEKKRSVRRGYLGAGVGVGAVSGVDGSSDLVTALNLRLGLVFSPRVGAGFELVGMAHAKDSSGEIDYAHTSIGVSVVFMVEPRVWFSLGGGYAQLFIRPKQERPPSELGGVAFNAAVGYEVWQSSSGMSALDLHLRAASGVYGSDYDLGTVALLLGFVGFGDD